MAESRSKITILCREDFANVNTEIAHALRDHSKIWEAKVIAFGPHVFDYALKHDLDLIGSTLEARKAGEKYLAESSVVIWAEEATNFGDDFSVYGPANGLGGALLNTEAKRRYTFHAGMAYRYAAPRYNPRDRETFDGQLCSPDLLRLANPGARCVWGKPMNVDLAEVDRLWEERRAYGKIVVTHSPSNHWTKGTPMIRRVMERVARACPNVEYRELGGPTGEHLSNEELLRARAGAVLHIDQYHTDIGGVGVASFEAMARGTLPLASVNRIGTAAYQQWGMTPASFPLIPLAFDGQEKANEKQTERALAQILTNVGKMSLEKLEHRGRAAARWVNENLSDVPFVRSWEAQLAALAARPMKRAA